MTLNGNPEGQVQGHSDFEALYLLLSKRSLKLGPMLLLNINRTIYGESNGAFTFDLSDLERSKSMSLGFPSLISRNGA